MERPIGSRTFIARDVIKVEITLSDARAAGALLAESFFVLVGDGHAGDRYQRLEPIPADVLCVLRLATSASDSPALFGTRCPLRRVRR